jgi:hypothetical protein
MKNGAINMSTEKTYLEGVYAAQNTGIEAGVVWRIVYIIQCLRNYKGK